MHGIKFNSLRQFLLKNYNKETWERHNNLLALRVFLIHLFSLAVKQFFFFCFSLLCFTSQWRYVHVVWLQSIFKPLAIHHFFPYFMHFEYISVRTFSYIEISIVFSIFLWWKCIFRKYSNTFWFFIDHLPFDPHNI